MAHFALSSETGGTKLKYVPIEGGSPNSKPEASVMQHRIVGGQIFGKWSAWVFVPLSFNAALVLLLVWPLTRGVQFPAGSIDCDPNGNLWLAKSAASSGSDSHAAWSSRYALAITYGWGSLNFATAKTIDVAWDLVIGRGWQVVCAWIVYETFTRYWTMELRRLQHKLPVEIAIALQHDTASISSLWMYGRITFKRDGPWALRKSTCLLAACVAYTLVVPTWLSAMTGYVSISNPMINVNETTVVGAAALRPCKGGILMDYARVDMPPDTCVDASTALQNYTKQYYTYGLDRANWTSSSYNYSTGDYDKFFTNSTSRFINDEAKVYDLGSPLLNFSQPKDLSMMYEGHVFNRTTLRSKGICQTTSSYRWGFSGQLTLGFLLTTVILSGALHWIWLSGILGLRQGFRDPVFGSLTTSLAVSEAIGEATGEPGRSMSNAELVKLMQDHGGGITVAESSDSKAEPA